MNSLPTVPSPSSRDWNAPRETSELSFEDQAALVRATRELERTSLAIRLSAIIGRQVSAIGSIIPANISEIANKAAETAIRSGLNFLFRSLAGKPLRDRRRMHKSLAVLAGDAQSLARGKQSLARGKKVTLPEGYKRDFKACRRFLDEHAR